MAVVLREDVGTSDPAKQRVRRMTSRAALIRQSSVALLRKDTTPSLLRKTSATNLFPEWDDLSQGPGIELFYYSGWDGPRLHYRTSDQAWTDPPGKPLSRMDTTAKTAAHLPQFGNVSLADESIWTLHVKGILNLEFIPNNGGGGWDKAPGNRHYHIEHPGRFLLRHGKVQQLLEPPKKPALLQLAEVGTTHVVLGWNPPLLDPADVAGYKIYRDGAIVGSVGESEQNFTDRNLLGLTDYVYMVRAINALDQSGPPSDSVTASTGDPGRPSAPQEVRVTTHSETGIEIVWKAPAEHGGSLVRAYQIYRNGKLHAVHPACAGSDEHYLDQTNVVKGERYFYHISAIHKATADAAQRFTEVAANPMAMRTFAEQSDDEVFVDPDEEAASQLEAAANKSPEDLEAAYKAAAHNAQTQSEGILSSFVTAKAVKMMICPRLHDGRSHIILQAFNWVSCKNRTGWYKVLKSKIPLMKEAGISMLWLPPPAQSVSKEGYMPTKWYNLNSWYGTEEELRDLNSSLEAADVAPMLDLVVNHRCGTKQDNKGQWTIYEAPDWGPWAIVSNNMQGYSGGSQQDTGTQSECAPDIDHTNNKVREDIKLWTKWLFNDYGFATVRIDMAPGYSVGYQVEYMEHLGSPFSVGEYWNGDPNSLQNYTSGGKGRIAAFDFALYYVLRRCVEGNDFGDMRDGGKLQGLVGRDPGRAVTFLDNHDTEHLSFVGKFGNGNGDMVLRGYVFLLTHPGTPCLYWNHFSDYGEYMRKQITALCKLRSDMGICSVSGVHIDVAQWGLYAAYISKDRHCRRGEGQIAVKIGSNNWGPHGGGWKKAVDGSGFCVWARS